MENHYKNNQNQEMKLALLTGLMGMAWCGDNEIKGPGNVVLNGKDNKIEGRKNNVDGWNNKVNGDFNYIKGDKNDAKGNENLVDGNRNMVIGDGNIVMGQGNFVNDDLSVNIDTNWGKNIQSEQPTPQMQQNPFFGWMNMGMMINQGMGAQLQQAMMKKMQMEMEMKLSQMRGYHNAGYHKANEFGQTKKDS